MNEGLKLHGVKMSPSSFWTVVILGGGSPTEGAGSFYSFGEGDGDMDFKELVVNCDIRNFSGFF